MKNILISVILYLTASSLLAEGFRAGTEIQTLYGSKPIETLVVGDKVLTCSFDSSSCVEKEILATKSHITNKAIEIQIGEEILVTEDDQKFFSEELSQWVNATEYFIKNYEEDIELYSLSIEDDHNFYITKSKIIAHNFGLTIFAPLAGLGPVGVAVGVGILAVGMVVYSQKNKDNKKAKEKKNDDPRHREDTKKKKLEDKNAADFEKEISKLPPGEKVALIKEVTSAKSKKYGWTKNNDLSKKNKRDIYTDKDGNHWSVDTRHGRFEKLDKRGKHQGEFKIDLEPVRDSKDNSGGHDIHL